MHRSQFDTTNVRGSCLRGTTQEGLSIHFCGGGRVCLSVSVAQERSVRVSSHTSFFCTAHGGDIVGSVRQSLYFSPSTYVHDMRRVCRTILTRSLFPPSFFLPSFLVPLVLHYASPGLSRDSVSGWGVSALMITSRLPVLFLSLLLPPPSPRWRDGVDQSQTACHHVTTDNYHVIIILSETSGICGSRGGISQGEW